LQKSYIRRLREIQSIVQNYLKSNTSKKIHKKKIKRLKIKSLKKLTFNRIRLKRKKFKKVRILRYTNGTYCWKKIVKKRKKKVTVHAALF